MDSQVGAVLRRARSRRKVELSEVEAATRIRLRYLRAIESEDWDVLPGGVYTRGFIRAYANFLGLDGDRLAEDYRGSVEGGIGASGGGAATGAPLPRQGAPEPARRLRLGWLVAVTGAILLAAVVVVLLPGESNNGGGHQAPRQDAARSAVRPQAKPEEQATQKGVLLRLTAGAEVWVCLLDARGEPLVDGQILETGAEAGPFRSGSFTVSFGNGEVTMTVDGSEAEIPPTPSPVGYSIGAGGSLSELSEAERPTCT